MPRKPKNPQTAAEWQDALDAATGALTLDAARQYGIVKGGPEVNVERCIEIIRGARVFDKAIKPRRDAIERFTEACLAESK